MSIHLQPGNNLSDRVWRATALKNTGDAAAANALMDGALTELPSAQSLHLLLPPASDVLVALGRYRDALSLEPSKPARRDWQWAVAQANLAEAEYCKGHRELAQARLSNPALDSAVAISPFATSVVALQRAWLAVELKDATAALAHVGAVTPADCPRSYRAEWYFTSAAAHSLAGHRAEADAALDAGARLSVRSSSVRNALALRGMLMRARGNPREAEKWLARAAAHRWRCQSGGVVLAWGDVLSELGRADEAREAWRRAVLEDPESEAAAIAAKR